MEGRTCERHLGRVQSVILMTVHDFLNRYLHLCEYAGGCLQISAGIIPSQFLGVGIIGDCCSLQHFLSAGERGYTCQCVNHLP